MNHLEITQVVYSVLLDKANILDSDMSESTPLGSEGLGIDSVGFLEIVLELEKRLGVMIRDEHLTADSLSTAGSLICLLEDTWQKR